MTTTLSEPRPHRSRSRRLVGRLTRLVAYATLFLIVFGVGFYLTMRIAFTGREVNVPAVTGLALDEARMALNAANLILEVTAERHDDLVPKGSVQSQEPLAGAGIKVNRKIRVILSLGPLRARIPDVRGESLRTAQIALRREGLSPGHVTFAHASAVAAERVMAQNPPPTPEVAEGTGVEAEERGAGDGTVSLLVSRGTRDPVFVMPDLTGRTLSHAMEFTRRAGLRMGAVRREQVQGVAKGRVARQSPRAGGPVIRQEIVTIVVAE